MRKFGLHIWFTQILAAVAPVLIVTSSIQRVTAQAIARQISSAVTAQVANVKNSAVLGGLGTGSMRLTSDGAITNVTINNNWLQPTGELHGCFGAVSIRSGKQAASCVIARRNAYGLTSPSGLEFEGSFPEANLHCSEGSFRDADVTLRAFTPFVPGDHRNSSLPVAAFVFHVVNHSGSPINVAVALSWENTLGIGQTLDGKAFANRTGNSVTPMPDSEGFFGLKFAGPLAAGTSSQESTVDGATGNMTLMAHPFRNNAVVTSAGWNSLDSKPQWWDSFASEGVVSGNAEPGIQGKSHPAGVVAVQLVLKPRESIDVPMCISWYTPILRGSNGDDYGHYYAAEFADSTGVARSVLDNWQALLVLTSEWRKRITSSNLPVDLDNRIIDSASTLVTNSIFVKDGRFTLLPGPEAGSGIPVESYILQRRDASSLLLALLPQLYAQEMVNLMAARIKNGEFPTSSSDWAKRIGPAAALPDPAEADEGNPVDLPAASPTRVNDPEHTERKDTSALLDASEYVVQADRLVSESNDVEFLHYAMQSIRTVVMGFETRDGTSAVYPPKGSTTQQEPTEVVLINWLALLRSARRLALAASSHAFEWATLAGPLGSSPGGLIEIGTEQHFVEICDREISTAEAQVLKRGVTLLASPAPFRKEVPGETESEGLKHAASWDLLNQIDGFRIDLLSGELDLTTPIPGDWRTLAAPVFSAAFVGRTEFKPTAHGGLLTFRIDRTISLTPVRSYRHRAGSTGVPQLRIRTMRIAGPPPIKELGVANPAPRAIDVRVSLGHNPVGCTTEREASGTLMLTFASPVTLLTGDLLQVEVQ